MKISSFLQPDTAESAEVKEIVEVKEVDAQRRRKSSISGGWFNLRFCMNRLFYLFNFAAVPPAQQQAPKNITLDLKIDKYDVILVEKMDDINCLSLILNVSNSFSIHSI